MLTIGPENIALYPRSPKSLKSQWEIHIPDLTDPIEVIEIEELFLASLGAHSPHMNHLFGTIRKPTYSEIALIECCFAFQFDCPCAIVDPRFKKEAGEIAKGVIRLKKKFTGIFHEDFFDPFDGIKAQVDVASEHDIDGYVRMLDNINSQTLRWKMSLPSGIKMKNALHSYRMARLSLDPFSRILNYWRSLEPITTVAERRAIFEVLPTITLKPVLVSNWKDRRQFDIMKTYVGEAKLQFDNLIRKGLTPSDICDHYYRQRRCAIAHAANNPLGYDSGISLGELQRDTIVMKVVARHAIEKLLQ